MRSNITKRVMAGVAVIYAVRVLTGATALKAYALLLSVWGVGKLVWVSKVVENFIAVEKNGLRGMGEFALTAVSHAHLGVQLVLLVSVLAAGSLFLDLARAATPRTATLAA